MKLKNLLFRLFLFIFIFSSNTPTTAKYLPNVKGLFDLLTPDDIGLGFALSYTDFIENVHTYAPKTKLKVLIEMLWKRINVESAKPTYHGVQACVTPEIFGELMASIYILNFLEEEKKLKGVRGYIKRHNIKGEVKRKRMLAQAIKKVTLTLTRTR